MESEGNHGGVEWNVRLEEFFDLRIAVLEPGETAPPGTHWARSERPPQGPGWLPAPVNVTWVLRTPASLEAYVLDAFRTGTRNKPRKLLREVPQRWRFDIREDVDAREAFLDLYRRTIVAKPRGRDRLTERGGGVGPGWRGFHLWEGDALVAGLRVHLVKDRLSIAYGAFDPKARAAADVEHYLIMQVIERAAAEGVGWISLGMDTNRYGHHLPLGLPAYKLRIGFTPQAWEPTGREWVRPLAFDVFEEGLFFFSYEGEGLAGRYYVRGEPDLRPFRHHQAPPVHARRI